MTDKQIIIDGVDVKDCKRRIGKNNYCRYYKRPCAENNYNCIWKKYLRKERECEELKKYQYEQEFLQEQLDKVIKENKELKTCYKNNLTLLDKEQVNTTKLVNKVMKLEKTLTEIKEIAEGNCKLCLSVDGFKKPDDCGICEYAAILQKICECEVEDGTC